MSVYYNYLPDSFDEIDAKREFLKSKDIGLGEVKPLALDSLSKESFTDDRARIDLNIHGIPFPCIFSNMTGQHKKLYVLLSSGGGRSRGPEFHRWTWYRYLPGMTINIEDPMFAQHPQLITAWFYGDENVSYLRYIQEFLEKFLTVFELKYQDLVFIGSSSGGYAALYLADLFLGSTAIAMNPQIILTNRKDVTIFEKTLGLSLIEQDKFLRNDIRHISANDTSRFFISANIVNKQDMWQIRELLYALNPKRKPQFPLTIENNFYFLFNKTAIKDSHHSYVLGNMIQLVEGILDNDFLPDAAEYLALYLSDAITNELLLKRKLTAAREKIEMLEGQIQVLCEKPVV